MQHEILLTFLNRRLRKPGGSHMLRGDRSGWLRGVARLEVSETCEYILIYLILLHLNTEDRGS